MDKQTYTKRCRCGNSFITENQRARKCEACKETTKFIHLQREYEKRKKPSKPKPQTDIFEFIRKLERYNAEHNTSLTYGQFEHIIHSKK